jgi:hypothetical protein
VAETRSMARHLREGFWPIAGAVLVNLRNILDALDVVADAQPVAVPHPTLRPALKHPSDRSTERLGAESR